MATKNNKNKAGEQEEKTAVPEPLEKQESGTEQTADEEKIFTSPEKPKVLIALRPVLYLSHQYKTGDALPVNNPEMVKAWLEAKSAKWKEEVKDALKQSP